MRNKDYKAFSSLLYLYYFIILQLKLHINRGRDRFRTDTDCENWRFRIFGMSFKHVLQLRLFQVQGVFFQKHLLYFLDPLNMLLCNEALVIDAMNQFLRNPSSPVNRYISLHHHHSHSLYSWSGPWGVTLCGTWKWISALLPILQNPQHLLQPTAGLQHREVFHKCQQYFQNNFLLGHTDTVKFRFNFIITNQGHFWKVAGKCCISCRWNRISQCTGTRLQHVLDLLTWQILGTFWRAYKTWRRNKDYKVFSSLFYIYYFIIVQLKLHINWGWDICRTDTGCEYWRFRVWQHRLNMSWSFWILVSVSNVYKTRRRNEKWRLLFHYYTFIIS